MKISHLEDMKRSEFERMVANGEVKKGEFISDKLIALGLKQRVKNEKSKQEMEEKAGWYSLSVAVSMLRDCGVDSHELQNLFREIVHILYEL